MLHLGMRLLALALPCACTATVTAPPSPPDPVRVFVLREALHTGLVLPPDPGAGPNADEFVEFGFGDWGWYANGEDSWYDVFATVLVPTQGALGRRTFGARDERELMAKAHWLELTPVVVDRARARELRRWLQRDYDAVRGAEVVRAQYGFRFVPAERCYWLPYTCNDAAADWLRQLDCTIGWSILRLGLTIAPNGS